MAKTTRLTAAHRREQIVTTARTMSYGGKLYDWSLQDVADRCGVSRATLAYYFASTKGLRSKIILAAVRAEDVAIVLQAMVKCDPLVGKIPDALRARCRESI